MIHQIATLTSQMKPRIISGIQKTVERLTTCSRATLQMRFIRCPLPGVLGAGRVDVLEAA
jgi:hypothetical protein